MAIDLGESTYHIDPKMIIDRKVLSLFEDVLVFRDVNIIKILLCNKNIYGKYFNVDDFIDCDDTYIINSLLNRPNENIFDFLKIVDRVPDEILNEILSNDELYYQVPATKMLYSLNTLATQNDIKSIDVLVRANDKRIQSVLYKLIPVNQEKYNVIEGSTDKIYSIVGNYNVIILNNIEMLKKICDAHINVEGTLFLIARFKYNFNTSKDKETPKIDIVKMADEHSCDIAFFNPFDINPDTVAKG